MKAIERRTRQALALALAAMLAGPLCAALPATNRLELVDGTIFTNVKFKRADEQTVTFSHAAGISRVPIVELSDDARALFKLTNDVPRPVPTAPQAPAVPASTSAPPAHVSSGYHACPGCQGAGTTVCPTCRGRQFGPDKTVESQCGACSGLGHIWVPVFSSYGGGAGRRVERWQSGSVRRTCVECDGKGRIQTRERTYCDACQGHGTIVCATCKGTRLVRTP